jgi:hypothetical protein
MGLNKKRIWLGALAGSVVWFVWSFITGQVFIGTARYTAEQQAGHFLTQPRYPFFVGQWFVLLFIASVILAHLYAWSRSTLGPGPMTALKIGLLVGFIGGFPGNFAQATWGPFDRIFPLSWMLDIWGGCVISTLIAAALYKGKEEAPRNPVAVVGR